MPSELTVHREVTITIDPLADPPVRNLAGLIAELTALQARNGIGPDAVVRTISGGVGTFRLSLTKPD
jgi:hypothetical protein